MTPEQAISILDNIVAKVSLSRREHEIVIEAVEVISSLIQSTDNKVSSEGEKNADQVE